MLEPPPGIRVVDRIRHTRNIQVDDFNYLKSQLPAGTRAKVTIPSPTMLHFRGGRGGISKAAYPELDPAFYDDVAAAYGDELHALAGGDVLEHDLQPRVALQQSISSMRKS